MGRESRGYGGGNRMSVAITDDLPRIAVEKTLAAAPHDPMRPVTQRLRWRVNLMNFLFAVGSERSSSARSD